MKKFIFPIALLLISSCNSKSSESFDFNKDQTAAYTTDESLPASEAADYSGKGRGEEDQIEPSQKNDLNVAPEKKTSEKTPQQIIKNANVQFQAENVEKSHDKIKLLLPQFNAYFGSDNASASSYQKDNNMVIRVPSANFEKLLDELMKESVYTNYKNISAEDVTAEYVDLQTRLKTKKEVEQRYIAILKQATKIPDILEVENNLRVIREEIEAAEGKMKLMKDQVAFSTITLNIYQKLDYTPEPEIGFLSNLKEAFVRGWRGLLDFVVGLVRIWPFVLIFGVLVFFIVRKIRARRKV